jgi:hypothetical protein
VAFAEPATMAVKAHTEAMAWAMDEASVPLVRVLGLESLVEYNSQPQVAGISTKADFGFLGYRLKYSQYLWKYWQNFLTVRKECR